MKHILLCLLFFGSFYSLAAQRLVRVEPLTDKEIHLDDFSDISLEIEFAVRLTNLSHDTLELKWEKKILNQPNDWITQINDENGIYLPNVTTNYGPIPGTESPLMLLPGQTSEVSLHIMPLGAEGEGWYQLAFSYADAPGYVLESLDFNASVGEAQAPTINVTKTDIRVYPNPAIYYFEITPNNLVDQIDVINVVGGKVLSFSYEHGQKYSIANLPSGLYMLSLVNHKKGVVKTVRLIKRTIRS